MIDLPAAQTHFHSGYPGSGTALYQAIVAVTLRMCSQRSIDDYRAADLAHDVATRVMERYQRNPRYTVKAWGALLRCELLHALTGGRSPSSRKQQIARAASLTASMRCAEPEPKDDATAYLSDLLGAHVQGQEIIVDLVRARSYKAGILAVERIAGRRWCYDHAVKLRRVWELTRRRN